MNKSKDGLDALREQYYYSVEAGKFRESEKQRLRTLRMLAVLGITGGSEPGNEWVRVRDVEVTLGNDYYGWWEWRARKPGESSTHSSTQRVESHNSELLYRLGRQREKLAAALVKAIEGVK